MTSLRELGDAITERGVQIRVVPGPLGFVVHIWRPSAREKAVAFGRDIEAAIGAAIKAYDGPRGSKKQPRG